MKAHALQGLDEIVRCLAHHVARDELPGRSRHRARVPHDVHHSGGRLELSQDLGHQTQRDDQPQVQHIASLPSRHVRTRIESISVDPDWATARSQNEARNATVADGAVLDASLRRR